MTALLKLYPVVTKPRLSVRAAAKFVVLPAVEQMKLLHDQKYPRQTPQVFMQPYYSPAISGIRGFLEQGPAALVNARAQIQRARVPSRRMHLNRVLEQFIQSDYAKRGLKPTPNRRYHAELSDLELRLSPDLFALEGGEERIIYFNANAAQQNPEIAKMTLEMAHWLLEENGVELKPEQIEFIDLFTGVLHKIKKRRSKTIKLLEENARLIKSLWPTIDP
jgi:hypothetical protein